jgi:hypothetical protein
MLALNSGVLHPLGIAKPVDREIQVNRKAMDIILVNVRKDDIDFLMLDPLVEFHRLKEVDNGDMSVVMGEIRTRSQAAMVGMPLSSAR